MATVVADRDGSSAKVDDLDEVRMADLLPSVVMVASMDRVDSAGGHRIALIVCRVKHRVRPSGGGVFCIHRTEVDSGRTTFGCPSVVPVSRCAGGPEGRQEICSLRRGGHRDGRGPGARERPSIGLRGSSTTSHPTPSEMTSVVVPVSRRIRKRRSDATAHARRRVHVAGVGVEGEAMRSACGCAAAGTFAGSAVSSRAMAASRPSFLARPLTKHTMSSGEVVRALRPESWLGSSEWTMDGARWPLHSEVGPHLQEGWC